MDITTIRLKRDVKERIEFYRKYPRETVEEILIRLLDYCDHASVKGGDI